LSPWKTPVIGKCAAGRDAGACGSHPARHPTLRAALDWSYRLCTPSEQQLWRRLSVFADPFELAAAMLVAGEADDHVPVEVLRGLVDKSIVSRDDRGCGTRYRLLEPIRQYGAEQLAAVEDPAARRDRHARAAG
jgi:predicted ATPase